MTDGELTERLLTLGLDDFEVKDNSVVIFKKGGATKK